MNRLGKEIICPKCNSTEFKRNPEDAHGTITLDMVEPIHSESYFCENGHLIWVQIKERRNGTLEFYDYGLAHVSA